MKIHADKIEGNPPHALSIAEVRCVLKAVPAEWIEGISEVHLSNSSQNGPRVFYSQYYGTLVIHSRGCSAELAVAMIMRELASVQLGHATRNWHRISKAERVYLQKVIQPYLDEVLSVVIPKPASESKDFIHTPTPAFQRVI